MRAGSPSGLALIAFLALAVPAGALAATLVVNSTSNTTVDADGNCTVREAVLNANADADTTTGDCLPGSGADVIEIPAGTYLLSAALSVTDDVTLHGAGAEVTQLDAQGLSGVLAVQENAGTVRVEGLTLTRGGIVGAINNHGAALTLLDSIVSDSAGVPAGALTNYKGTTTIERSLIRDNDGPTSCGVNSAGAISVFDGSLRIQNSTLSGNEGRCAQSAGAIHVGAGADSVAILFSTIANSTCTSNCPAIVNEAAAAITEVQASLLSNPEPGAPNCSDPLTSLGYNFETGVTCGLTGPTDLPTPAGTDDLEIGALKSNGGPPTHALLAGSPAIDAIPLEACGIDDDGVPETPEIPLEEDQRGAPRPADGDAGACDIGAYEGTYLNTAPLAVCENKSLMTPAGACSVAANVDGGSTDPNGDTLTFEQVPPGPYAPGTTNVTLHVRDDDPENDAAEDTCEAVVTVTDDRPPVISCPTAPVKRPKKGLEHNFGVPATDNCGSPTFAVSADPLHLPDCFTTKKGKKGAPDVITPQPCTILSDASGVHITVFPKKKSTMRWTIEAEDTHGNTATRVCEALAK
jgi:hypothetical protein